MSPRLEVHQRPNIDSQGKARMQFVGPDERTMQCEAGNKRPSTGRKISKQRTRMPENAIPRTSGNRAFDSRKPIDQGGGRVSGLFPRKLILALVSTL